MTHRAIPAPAEHFADADSFTDGRDRDLDPVVLWFALETLTEEVRRMSTQLDAIKSALAAEDTLIGQVTAFLSGLPAATAAAVSAATAGDATEAAAIQAEIEAHTATLATALKAAAPASTTAAPAVSVPSPPSPAPPANPPQPQP